MIPNLELVARVAFGRDNPNTTVQFIDTGHFALETHVEESPSRCGDFLGNCRTEWLNDQLIEPFMTKLLFITGVSLLTWCMVAGQKAAARLRNIILVHGASADGSGLKGVHDILVKELSLYFSPLVQTFFFSAKPIGRSLHHYSAKNPDDILSTNKT